MQIRTIEPEGGAIQSIAMCDDGTVRIRWRDTIAVGLSLDGIPMTMVEVAGKELTVHVHHVEKLSDEELANLQMRRVAVKWGEPLKCGKCRGCAIGSDCIDPPTRI